jgi:hypothetical protein
MVLVNGKRIFPMYIPPEKDELFSSWICRMSIEHQIKPYSFVKNYFVDYARFFSRNIDLLRLDSVVSTLLKNTPLNKNQIEDLFEGNVFEKSCVNGITTGLLPLGIFNRRRKNFGTLYCPSCLRKKIPYYKKQWRLSFSLVCLDCNVRLKDRCDKCKEPITYHMPNKVNQPSRMSYLQDSLSLKYCSCGHDLSIKNKLDLPPTEVELCYQKFIDMTMENGYNSISNYSFLYFNGLILLATKYLSFSNRNKFRVCLMGFHNREYLPHEKYDFGLWEIENRRTALIDVFLLLQHYKGDLTEFFNDHYITKTRFFSYANFPFWIYRAF